jgi:hypothetical protein
MVSGTFRRTQHHALALLPNQLIGTGLAGNGICSMQNLHAAKSFNF